MAKKYYDRDYVLKNLSISEKRLDRAIHVMKKRHPLELDWIYVRNALNGQTTIYYNIEFITWLKEVYFAKGYYLDLEIEFYKRLLKQLDSNYEDDIVYEDMSVEDLMVFFNQDDYNIRIAVCRMNRHYRDDLKYYIDGRLYVKAEGVKWLNEKYYRKSYLEYLEYQKLKLDGYDF